jgi:hypothetical protein
MNWRFIFFFSLIFSTQILCSQTFLHDFRDFWIQRLDTLKETNRDQGLKISEKWIKQYKDNLDQQILELDSIFSIYKKKNNFDFNIADSLIIIYQTSIESDLSDYIIYSGIDTISFTEFYIRKKPSGFQKRIMYKPFLNKSERKDLIEIDDRDSLLKLANKRDYSTALRLAKENPVLDGASSTIIFAKKIPGKYAIESCFLQPFGFLPIRRKK